MSILIKGMEMPKNGELKIHFATSPNGLTITLVEDKDGNALEHNGVVEVPTPHGRLIDAEPLTDNLADTRLIGHEMDGKPIYATYGVSTSIPVDRVYDAPTIIEAEE